MKNIENILLNEFRGQISPEEQDILKKWLAEKNNQEYYNELKRTWELTGKLNYNPEPNVEEQWKRFQELKENPAPLDYLKDHASESKSGKLVEFYLTRIAAVLVLGVVALYFILRTNQVPNEDNWISYMPANFIEEINLPDGSLVTLNKKSQLSFPDSLPGEERVVKLDGEAYFEVAKDGRAFKIITPETYIKVLGTEFNVRAFSEKPAEVQVNNGSVEFGALKGKKKVILKKGESAIHPVEKRADFIRTSLNPNLLAWKTGKLEFKNQSLGEALPAINRYFNRDFILGDDVAQIHFTGSFESPELHEFLEVLSSSTGLRVTSNEAGIRLYLPGKQ